MDRKLSLFFGVFVVVLIVVVSIGFFLLHRPGPSLKEVLSVEPTLGTQSGETGKTNLSEETVLAEIDGTTVKVSLPDGHQSPVTLPEELSEDLTLQTYQGLDPIVQKSESSFLWFRQHLGDRIFGRTITDDGQESSPVYVCNTSERVCDKTVVPGSETAVVPQGAISPTGRYIALILQHDVSNITTGTHWELLLYEGEHLSLVKTIDVSIAIDRTPDVSYDGVASVVWSPDEKRLALGANTKIAIVDLSSDVVSIAYTFETSSDEESVFPIWDTTALAWSSGGRYLVFAGFSDESSDTNDEESPDVLQAIDLEESNVLRTVIRGRSVGIVGE